MLNKKAKEQIKKAEEQIKEGYMYGVVGLVMAFVCAVLVCINYGLFDVFMKIFGICSCIMIIPAIIISVSGYIALKEAKNVLNASAGNTVDKDYIQQAVARWRLLLYLPIIGGGFLT